MEQSSLETKWGLAQNLVSRPLSEAGLGNSLRTSYRDLVLDLLPELLSVWFFKVTTEGRTKYFLPRPQPAMIHT